MVLSYTCFLSSHDRMYREQQQLTVCTELLFLCLHLARRGADTKLEAAGSFRPQWKRPKGYCSSSTVAPELPIRLLGTKNSRMMMPLMRRRKEWLTVVRQHINTVMTEQLDDDDLRKKMVRFVWEEDDERMEWDCDDVVSSGKHGRVRTSHLLFAPHLQVFLLVILFLRSSFFPCYIFRIS